MHFVLVNCNSRRESVRLFQFPKSETTLLNPKKSELLKKYVCEKHFEKHFLTSKSRLRMAAYPTLFTAEGIASGIPNTSGIKNRNPYIDHDYLKFQHFDHTYCKQAVTTFSGMNIRPVTPMTFQESAPSLITANYSDGKSVSRTLRNTAEVTSFLDDLIDSVNGACLAGKRNKGKPFRTVVTKMSPHHKLWQEAIEKYEIFT